jgi:CheY-like chemotaxis protein
MLADISPPAPIAPWTRCGVVLVDDDEAVRAALAFSLEIEGFKVATFPSAEDLLSQAPLPVCCCLVIDQRLPGVDGLALFVALRTAGVAAPGVLITTNPTAQLRARAESAGMQIVEKPLLGDGFVHAVRLLCCSGARAAHCPLGPDRPLSRAARAGPTGAPDEGLDQDAFGPRAAMRSVLGGMSERRRGKVARGSGLAKDQCVKSLLAETGGRVECGAAGRDLMADGPKPAFPATFRRVRLALAREPGHPEGDPGIGYEFAAPLDPGGRIDADAWREHRHLCRAVRFRPDEAEEVGHLVRRPGGSWAFRYDLLGDDDDEAGHHFGDHEFKAGEYVSVAEDGAMHTYRVVSVDRL